MNRIIKKCYQRGTGHIIEIIERTKIFWKFHCSRKKTYYVNESGCVYHPSYEPVRDKEEQSFVFRVVDSFKKKNVRI